MSQGDGFAYTGVNIGAVVTAIGDGHTETYVNIGRLDLIIGQGERYADSSVNDVPTLGTRFDDLSMALAGDTPHVLVRAGDEALTTSDSASGLVIH